MPCSGWVSESAVVGAVTRDLAVLRLIVLVALGLATFLVVFFLVVFADFLIGVFLAFFAFAFRPESISTKPFSSAATPSGYGRQL